jgi:hypothetical protein
MKADSSTFLGIICAYLRNRYSGLSALLAIPIFKSPGITLHFYMGLGMIPVTLLIN